MNDIEKKKVIIILGGKFSSKIAYHILKSKGFLKFIIYDNSLKEKFYKGEYSFIKKENFLIKWIKENSYLKKNFVLATSSMVARKKWIETFSIKKSQIINVISSDYVINHSKKLGNGNLIWSGVTLDYDCKIGNFNFINNSTLLLHDSILGNHNFIGPNTTILGNVSIGNNCYIGSNSIIDSKIKIGSNCIIGANSFINKDVKSGSKIFGTPGIKKS